MEAVRRVAAITQECVRLVDKAGSAGITRAGLLAGVREVVPDANERDIAQVLGEMTAMPVGVTLKPGIRITDELQRKLAESDDTLGVLVDIMELNGAATLGEILAKPESEQ